MNKKIKKYPKHSFHTQEFLEILSAPNGSHTPDSALKEAKQRYAEWEPGHTHATISKYKH